MTVVTFQDSDDAASTSSCDVALSEDVVHFRHTPRRSSSVISCSPTTPTNLLASVEDPGIPRTPTNDATSNMPANFKANQADKEPLVGV